MATHLTSFGAGLFVAPNPIDFSKVFAGFRDMAETGNVLVLSAIVALFGLYVLMAVYVRRADKRDMLQVLHLCFSVLVFVLQNICLRHS